MNRPLVSIITPSYNQGKFIRETIESVLTQDYDNVEYIIIDGGSLDNTLEIIEEYGKKITWISEKDEGQSDAINKGFRMAKGEIVAWLNSDDVYEEGCISKAVQEFQKNEKLVLVYGDGFILDEMSNKIRIFENTQEFDLWKLVNFWDYIMQPTTFFKKSSLQRVGYLDVDLNYCMDWDLWIKLSNIGEVKYIHDYLACSREYGTTKTSTGGKKRLEEIVFLLQKYSGKKRPLGIYSYKASSLVMAYSNKKILFELSKIYSRIIHTLLRCFIQTRSKDGWIPGKYEFCIPAYGNSCTFNIGKVAFPQIKSLLVSIDGKKVNTYDLKDKFIKIEMPNPHNLNTIQLKCLTYCWGRKKILQICDFELQSNL